MPDKKQSILEELKQKSKKLYILFGGISAGMGMPPFEFYNSSSIIDENKIFLRDLSQSWYQCGLPGIGNTVYDIAKFLNAKIRQIRPSEIFFVGNSMGGYAAILFASLLKCGKAIAFCPQTFISPIKRLIYGDSRWSCQILKTYKDTMLSTPRPIYDVKRLLSKDEFVNTIEVYVSRTDRMDFLHARRIEKFKNVFVYKYDVAGHNLVSYLRDQDQLQFIIAGTKGFK